ncbi:MAG: KH domain-containing protein [Clostridiaceae bacterium]
MKELVEFLAKSLVDKPEEVVVTEKEDGDTIIFELKVASDDMGKVIGKQGKIAKALRTLVRAASARDGKKVLIEIV